MHSYLQRRACRCHDLRESREMVLPFGVPKDGKLRHSGQPKNMHLIEIVN